MIVSPLGSFITRFDTALTGSIDGLIGAAVNYASTPIALCAVLYYITQGLRLAQGDAEVLHNFWGRLIRIGLLVWLATNLNAFNLWIRDFVFIGIPKGINAGMGPAMAIPPGTVASTAAMFDAQWSQIWTVVALVWEQVGFSASGVLSGLTGILTALFGGLCLAFIAMIYIGARMVLAILVCLTPFILILGIFDATKDVVARAIGKAISLIILQVAGFIVMEIVLLGNQWFMAQATNAIISALADKSLQAQALQSLVAICAWFAIGAYGIWEIRSVAYSLGGGVSGGGAGLIGFAALMSRMGGSRPGGGSFEGGFPSGMPQAAAPAPSYSMSMNYPAVSGSHASLPPPAPPPSLSHSTRP
jgi:hypothetical protein